MTTIPGNCWPPKNGIIFPRRTEFILQEWLVYHADLRIMLHQSGDYGFIYIKGISYIIIYPMLAPGIWNHLCLSYDTHNEHLIETFMNGKKIMSKKV